MHQKMQLVAFKFAIFFCLILNTVNWSRTTENSKTQNILELNILYLFFIA